MEKNNRDATPSYCGYIYQRHMCIYLLLKNEQNIKYIMEEGNEDIDLIYNDNNIDAIQVKYYKNGKDETFNYKDGLFKVVEANYNKNNIKKIIFSQFNQKTFFNTNLLDSLQNKKWLKLGKYMIIQTYNKYHNKNNKKDKITVNINNIEKIEENFKNHEYLLKKYKDKDKYFRDIFDYFIDKEKCKDFFNKIELKEGDSFDKLSENINSLIEQKYKDFINIPENDKIKTLKISLIFICIYNLLNDYIFSTKNNDRKIEVNEIKNNIIETIKTYENNENIVDELLKQYYKISINTIGNKDLTIYNINNIIKNFNKIDDKYISKQIMFLIYYINNHFLNINNETYQNIINFIINKCFDKYLYDKQNNDFLNKSTQDTFVYNKKFIDKTRALLYNRTINNKRHHYISYKLINELIDINFNSNEMNKLKKMLREINIINKKVSENNNIIIQSSGKSEKPKKKVNLVKKIN